uniref:Uncharacterized protein n=1 Tax=Spironucleus salmonicida TaxID=348837 RepID=V6LYD6_9EUKA|eukprot:EST49590.1 Hypothetical protein SS50377_10046 [Spironucleus salmonicida]
MPGVVTSMFLKSARTVMFEEVAALLAWQSAVNALLRGVSDWNDDTKVESVTDAVKVFANDTLMACLAPAAVRVMLAQRPDMLAETVLPSKKYDQGVVPSTEISAQIEILLSVPFKFCEIPQTLVGVPVSNCAKRNAKLLITPENSSSISLVASDVSSFRLSKMKV